MAEDVDGGHWMPWPGAGDKAGDNEGVTRVLGQGPAEHPPGLNHRSPTEAGMGVHPICSLLVPLGRLQAIIHPWG